jgi:hypothetical protein
MMFWRKKKQETVENKSIDLRKAALDRYDYQRNLEMHNHREYVVARFREAFGVYPDAIQTKNNWDYVVSYQDFVFENRYGTSCFDLVWQCTCGCPHYRRVYDLAQLGQVLASDYLACDNEAISKGGE